ncbi:MAG: fumarylacetoacetate hydrolase family protein [Rhizomicrobium sp.]
MRLGWFDDSRLGLVAEDAVRDVTAALGALPPASYPAIGGDPVITHLSTLVAAIGGARPAGPVRKLADARFLSPVGRPTKIIGTPANYHEHVEEADAQAEVFTKRYAGSIREQGMFLKAVSALVGPSQGVTLRFPDRRNDHEMELGVVIGRKGSDIAPADALDHVAGYTIALDMVVRGSEDRSFRKSIDSYAVAGPWLVTPDEIGDPQDLDFSLAVNGEMRQRSNTRLMIMGIAEQIAWASQFYTLWPGDIIMTGTCAGVGPVRPGDVMHCEIEKIGAMDVRVR